MKILARLCCILSLLLAVALTSDAQKKDKVKFHSAPINAKGIVENGYAINLPDGLSEAEAEKVIDELISKYKLQLRKDREHSVIPFLRVFYVTMSEAEARQVSEDEAVEGVGQIYEVPIIPPPNLEYRIQSRRRNLR